METGTWLGFGALLVSAAGALNSMRAGRREDRTSAVAELKIVVDELREENKRLKAEMRESEEECRRQIDDCNVRLKAQQQQVEEMRGTIISQAHQLNQLDRRQHQRPDGEQ